MTKKRLDVLVFERGLAPSREMARRFILAGEVLVDGAVMDKAGSKFDESVAVSVKSAPKYVSRGGEKLEGAFQQFPLDVVGKICADVGASTGGFTECLLQNGASKVYAIDVGYGQIALKLREDARVVVIERTNARYIEALDDPIDFVTIDASFISLKLLLPAIKNWLTDGGHVLALVKPQFEAGRRDVGKGGVVKDSEVHQRVLMDVTQDATSLGYFIWGIGYSPITGPKGNVEFLMWLSTHEAEEAVDLDSAIQTAITQSDSPNG